MFVKRLFVSCYTLMFWSILAATSSGAGLGSAVTDFQLKDYLGKTYSWSDFEQSEVVVLAFMGTECPLAKLYAGRLQELAENYALKRVAIVAVNSNIQDSVTEVAAWARRHGITFPVLKDPAQSLANQTGAERTPQVFLLDKNRIIRYQGRIDDQYVVGIVRDAPTRADLQIAIDELLAGKKITVAETEPLGCLIGRATPPNEQSPVTYSNQIARIFQKRCVECHRTGEIAPFPLQTYQDVLGWGPMIEEVVREQRMPPWHADSRHGKFANDRSLTKQEKELIYTWVKNGSPEGNPEDLPQPLEFVSGWQLPREPDAVFEMADKPFQIASNAGPRGIPYQRFWVEPNFEEDKWVIGAEARPGNRAVVHHIIVYVHPHGKGTREHEFFCAYVPGLRLQQFSPGVAKKIPAGSALRFEMHYTPIGSPQEDLSSVGFLFTDPSKVTHEVRTLHVANGRFELKPFQDDQVVTATSKKSPITLQLLSMSPHMHLRGKAFQYEAIFPDGSQEILLNVPHYDFNWQTQYRLAEPREIPAGTKLFCSATFDNSDKNLANPDPSATVRWGDQSWDEMMLGYYDVMLPVNLPASDSAGKTDRDDFLNADFILRLADRNKDKSISVEESQAFPLLAKEFTKVDLDNNGAVSAAELQRVIQHLKTKRAQ